MALVSRPLRPQRRPWKKNLAFGTAMLGALFTTGFVARPRDRGGVEPLESRASVELGEPKPPSILNALSEEKGPVLASNPAAYRLAQARRERDAQMQAREMEEKWLDAKGSAEHAHEHFNGIVEGHRQGNNVLSDTEYAQHLLGLAGEQEALARHLERANRPELAAEVRDWHESFSKWQQEAHAQARQSKTAGWNSQDRRDADEKLDEVSRNWEVIKAKIMAQQDQR